MLIIHARKEKVKLASIAEFEKLLKIALDYYGGDDTAEIFPEMNIDKEIKKYSELTLSKNNLNGLVSRNQSTFKVK